MYHPYCLVIVDMQPRFEAARCEETQAAIVELVKEARKNNALIVVLEYYNWNNLAASMQNTCPAIMQALRGYNHVEIRQKDTDDGSQQIMDYVDDEMEFVVCGVNWGACVQATVMGLMMEYNIDGEYITIVENACNEPSHWGISHWLNTQECFEANNVNLIRT